MSLLVLQRRRDSSFDITIVESGGTDYVYVANDVIRVKIGREGAAPILDLDSAAATANGSSVSAANPCTVTLRAADAELLSRGIYQLEISVVDDSDDDQIKSAQTHVVCVVDTQTGDVGLT